jgi:hypothetical protein
MNKFPIEFLFFPKTKRNYRDQKQKCIFVKIKTKFFLFRLKVKSGWLKKNIRIKSGIFAGEKYIHTYISQ